MRKILIAPLLIITTIVLIIWVIYPMYTSDSVKGGGVLEKKMVLQAEREKMEKVGVAMENAQSLSFDIESNVADSEVLFDYISKNREEEKLIESVNSLANENSLFVLNISITDAKEDDVTEEIPPTTLSTPIVEQDVVTPDIVSAEALLEESITKERMRTKKLNLDISLIGEYSEIKAFINKMYGLKRSNQVYSLKMNKLESSSASNGEGASPSRLQANMTFRFNYVKPLNTAYNFDLSNPVFSSSIFNKSVLDDIRKKSVNVLNVELRQDGSANPFTQ